MSFDGKEGAFISLNDAAALTAEYRNGQSSPVLGHFYGKENLLKLLNQSGCLGIRIYHGIDAATASPELVLVGADANENDILAASPLILDGSSKCPPSCGNNNSLNS